MPPHKTIKVSPGVGALAFARAAPLVAVVAGSLSLSPSTAALALSEASPIIGGNVLIRDIKADYGALGDGQLVNAVISIANGSPTLSSTTAIWAPGDVGKFIAYGTYPNSLGNQIDAVAGDGKSLTLQAPHPGSTIASQSLPVEWGHDDTPAFKAFNTEMTGRNGVVLNVPAGRYLFVSGFSGVPFSGISLGPFFNIDNLTVQGPGSAPWAVFSDVQGAGSGYFLGSAQHGQFFDNAHSARIDTVAAGSTTISLKNIGDAALFSVGQCCKMTGFDMQGFGNPSNQFFYENVIISSISGANIGISSPLANSYEDSWPLFFAGSSSSVDCGGPATLYALGPGFDATQTYNGLGLEQASGQISSAGRFVTFNGGYVTGAGIYPGLHETWTCNNVDMSSMNNMEVDKLVGILTLNNCLIHGLNFQSASPDTTYLTDCAISGPSGLNGCGKTLVISGGTCSTCSFGPGQYGSDREVIASNWVVDEIAGAGTAAGEFDVFGVGAYSINNGTLTRAMTGGTGETPVWATPGTQCFMSGSLPASFRFKVLDCVSDGTTLTITTDITAPGIPPIPNSGVYTIACHDAPRLTFTNVTGCDRAVGLSGFTSAPKGSRWTYTYDANIGTTKGVIPITGKIVSVKFTVNSGYTAGTFNLDNPFVVQISNGLKLTWSPVIDLTIAGTRTVTPSGVTGVSGADVGLALPGDMGIWLVPNQITPKMSGAAGNGSIELDIITDQGF